jgi:hypothetical protein
MLGLFFTLHLIGIILVQSEYSNKVHHYSHHFSGSRMFSCCYPSLQSLCSFDRSWTTLRTIVLNGQWWLHPCLCIPERIDASCGSITVFRSFCPTFRWFEGKVWFRRECHINYVLKKQKRTLWNKFWRLLSFESSHLWWVCMWTCKRSQFVLQSMLCFWSSRLLCQRICKNKLLKVC